MILRLFINFSVFNRGIYFNGRWNILASYSNNWFMLIFVVLITVTTLKNRRIPHFIFRYFHWFFIYHRLVILTKTLSHGFL